jgi:hypothetical protein
MTAQPRTARRRSRAAALLLAAVPVGLLAAGTQKHALDTATTTHAGNDICVTTAVGAQPLKQPSCLGD